MFIRVFDHVGRESHMGRPCIDHKSHAHFVIAGMASATTIFGALSALTKLMQS
jgi:hypothetical protein